MTEDPFEDNERCGFCNKIIIGDEELEPIYVGDPPKPKRIKSEETVPIGGYPHNVDLGLGKTVGEIEVLLKALKNCPEIEVETIPRVLEYQYGGSPYFDPGDKSFSSPNDEELSLAHIKVRPTYKNIEPDLEVCEDCVEKFQS